MFDVEDQQLNASANIFKPKSIIPTTVKFIDIIRLVSGSSKGESLVNQFLSYIRDVVLSFKEVNVTHVESSIHPVHDIKTIEIELLIKDISTIKKRIRKQKHNVCDKNIREN